jgi:hypothetical protein
MSEGLTGPSGYRWFRSRALAVNSVKSGRWTWTLDVGFVGLADTNGPGYT